ncbi:hypothetical protein ADICYQ_3666 [Cyclobacterium qasimii M12-11B]|uniref:Uncharacterized protein n=1 Tax=Cyclobacterium qasimii M12-11B TaxID=641524 RepID=S7VAM8_9BACT|nr:hypothetical protein ADICYQ_3666 [Cyclobacterium qasimii M12-11B]
MGQKRKAFENQGVRFCLRVRVFLNSIKVLLILCVFLEKSQCK